MAVGKLDRSAPDLVRMRRSNPPTTIEQMSSDATDVEKSQDASLSGAADSGEEARKSLGIDR